MRRRSARPSLRDTLTANNAADNFYASMAGVAPRGQAAVAPKRERAAPDPNDSEAPVKNAVSELLAQHPQVLFAVRQNSGSLAYQGANGRAIPVWFYKLVRAPEHVTVTDFWGFLRDGKPYALECKRPSWKWPKTPSDREVKQRAFIQMIEAIGGVGGFVRSADEAKAVLP